MPPKKKEKGKKVVLDQTSDQQSQNLNEAVATAARGNDSSFAGGQDWRRLQIELNQLESKDWDEPDQVLVGGYLKLNPNEPKKEIEAYEHVVTDTEDDIGPLFDEIDLFKARNATNNIKERESSLDDFDRSSSAGSESRKPSLEESSSLPPKTSVEYEEVKGDHYEKPSSDSLTQKYVPSVPSDQNAKTGFKIGGVEYTAVKPIGERGERKERKKVSINDSEPVQFSSSSSPSTPGSINSVFVYNDQDETKETIEQRRKPVLPVLKEENESDQPPVFRPPVPELPRAFTMRRQSQTANFSGFRTKFSAILDTYQENDPNKSTKDDKIRSSVYANIRSVVQEIAARAESLRLERTLDLSEYSTWSINDCLNKLQNTAENKKFIDGLKGELPSVIKEYEDLISQKDTTIKPVAKLKKISKILGYLLMSDVSEFGGKNFGDLLELVIKENEHDEVIGGIAKEVWEASHEHLSKARKKISAVTAATRAPSNLQQELAQRVEEMQKKIREKAKVAEKERDQYYKEIIENLESGRKKVETKKRLRSAIQKAEIDEFGKFISISNSEARSELKPVNAGKASLRDDEVRYGFDVTTVKYYYDLLRKGITLNRSIVEKSTHTQSDVALEADFAFFAHHNLISDENFEDLLKALGDYNVSYDTVHNLQKQIIDLEARKQKAVTPDESERLSKERINLIDKKYKPAMEKFEKIASQYVAYHLLYSKDRNDVGENINDEKGNKYYEIKITLLRLFEQNRHITSAKTVEQGRGVREKLQAIANSSIPVVSSQIEMPGNKKSVVDLMRRFQKYEPKQEPEKEKKQEVHKELQPVEQAPAHKDARTSTSGLESKWWMREVGENLPAEDKHHILDLIKTHTAPYPSSSDEERISVGFIEKVKANTSNNFSKELEKLDVENKLQSENIRQNPQQALDAMKQAMAYLILLPKDDALSQDGVKENDEYLYNRYKNLVPSLEAEIAKQKKVSQATSTSTLNPLNDWWKRELGELQQGTQSKAEDMQSTFEYHVLKLAGELADQPMQNFDQLLLGDIAPLSQGLEAEKQSPDETVLANLAASTQQIKALAAQEDKTPIEQMGAYMMEMSHLLALPDSDPRRSGADETRYFELKALMRQLVAEHFQNKASQTDKSGSLWWKDELAQLRRRDSNEILPVISQLKTTNDIALQTDDNAIAKEKQTPQLDTTSEKINELIATVEANKKSQPDVALPAAQELLARLITLPQTSTLAKTGADEALYNQYKDVTHDLLVAKRTAWQRAEYAKLNKTNGDEFGILPEVKKITKGIAAEKVWQDLNKKVDLQNLRDAATQEDVDVALKANQELAANLLMMPEMLASTQADGGQNEYEQCKTRIVQINLEKLTKDLIDKSIGEQEERQKQVASLIESYDGLDPELWDQWTFDSKLNAIADKFPKTGDLTPSAEAQDEQGNNDKKSTKDPFRFDKEKLGREKQDAATLTDEIRRITDFLDRAKAIKSQQQISADELEQLKRDQATLTDKTQLIQRAQDLSVRLDSHLQDLERADKVEWWETELRKTQDLKISQGIGAVIAEVIEASPLQHAVKVRQADGLSEALTTPVVIKEIRSDKADNENLENLGREIDKLTAQISSKEPADIALAKVRAQELEKVEMRKQAAENKLKNREKALPEIAKKVADAATQFENADEQNPKAKLNKALDLAAYRLITAQSPNEGDKSSYNAAIDSAKTILQQNPEFAEEVQKRRVPWWQNRAAQADEKMQKYLAARLPEVLLPLKREEVSAVFKPEAQQNLSSFAQARSIPLQGDDNIAKVNLANQLKEERAKHLKNAETQANLNDKAKEAAAATLASLFADDAKTYDETAQKFYGVLREIQQAWWRPAVAQIKADPQYATLVNFVLNQAKENDPQIVEDIATLTGQENPTINLEIVAAIKEAPALTEAQRAAKTRLNQAMAQKAQKLQEMLANKAQAERDPTYYILGQQLTIPLLSTDATQTDFEQAKKAFDDFREAQKDKPNLNRLQLIKLEPIEVKFDQPQQAETLIAELRKKEKNVAPLEAELEKIKQRIPQLQQAATAFNQDLTKLADEVKRGVEVASQTADAAEKLPQKSEQIKAEQKTIDDALNNLLQRLDAQIVEAQQLPLSKDVEDLKAAVRKLSESNLVAPLAEKITQTRDVIKDKKDAATLAQQLDEIEKQKEALKSQEDQINKDIKSAKVNAETITDETAPALGILVTAIEPSKGEIAKQVDDLNKQIEAIQAAAKLDKASQTPNLERLKAAARTTLAELQQAQRVTRGKLNDAHPQIAEVAEQGENLSEKAEAENFVKPFDEELQKAEDSNKEISQPLEAKLNAILAETDEITPQAAEARIAELQPQLATIKQRLDDLNKAVEEMLNRLKTTKPIPGKLSPFVFDQNEFDKPQTDVSQLGELLKRWEVAKADQPKPKGLGKIWSRPKPNDPTDKEETALRTWLTPKLQRAEELKATKQKLDEQAQPLHVFINPTPGSSKADEGTKQKHKKVQDAYTQLAEDSKKLAQEVAEESKKPELAKVIGKLQRRAQATETPEEARIRILGPLAETNYSDPLVNVVDQIKALDPKKIDAATQAEIDRIKAAEDKSNQAIKGVKVLAEIITPGSNPSQYPQLISAAENARKNQPDSKDAEALTAKLAPVLSELKEATKKDLNKKPHAPELNNKIAQVAALIGKLKDAETETDPQLLDQQTKALQTNQAAVDDFAQKEADNKLKVVDPITVAISEGNNPKSWPQQIAQAKETQADLDQKADQLAQQIADQIKSLQPIKVPTPDNDDIIPLWVSDEAEVLKKDSENQTDPQAKQVAQALAQTVEDGLKQKPSYAQTIILPKDQQGNPQLDLASIQWIRQQVPPQEVAKLFKRPEISDAQIQAGELPQNVDKNKNLREMATQILGGGDDDKEKYTVAKKKVRDAFAQAQEQQPKDKIPQWIKDKVNSEAQTEPQKKLRQALAQTVQEGLRKNPRMAEVITLSQDENGNPTLDEAAVALLRKQIPAEQKATFFKLPQMADSQIQTESEQNPQEKAKNNAKKNLAEMATQVVGGDDQDKYNKAEQAVIDAFQQKPLIADEIISDGNKKDKAEKASSVLPQPMQQAQAFTQPDKINEGTADDETIAGTGKPKQVSSSTSTSGLIENGKPSPAWVGTELDKIDQKVGEEKGKEGTDDAVANTPYTQLSNALVQTVDALTDPQVAEEIDLHGPDNNQPLQHIDKPVIDNIRTHTPKADFNAQTADEIKLKPNATTQAQEAFDKVKGNKNPTIDDLKAAVKSMAVQTLGGDDQAKFKEAEKFVVDALTQNPELAEEIEVVWPTKKVAGVAKPEMPQPFNQQPSQQQPIAGTATDNEVKGGSDKKDGTAQTKQEGGSVPPAKAVDFVLPENKDQSQKPSFANTSTSTSQLPAEELVGSKGEEMGGVAPVWVKPELDKVKGKVGEEKQSPSMVDGEFNTPYTKLSELLGKAVEGVTKPEVAKNVKMHGADGNQPVEVDEALINGIRTNTPKKDFATQVEPEASKTPNAKTHAEKAFAEVDKDKDEPTAEDVKAAVAVMATQTLGGEKGDQSHPKYQEAEKFAINALTKKPELAEEIEVIWPLKKVDGIEQPWMPVPVTQKQQEVPVIQTAEDEVIKGDGDNDNGKGSKLTPVNPDEVKDVDEQSHEFVQPDRDKNEKGDQPLHVMPQPGRDKADNKAEVVTPKGKSEAEKKSEPASDGPKMRNEAPLWVRQELQKLLEEVGEESKSKTSDQPVRINKFSIVSKSLARAVEANTTPEIAQLAKLHGKNNDQPQPRIDITAINTIRKNSPQETYALQPSDTKPDKLNNRTKSEQDFAKIDKTKTKPTLDEIKTAINVMATSMLGGGDKDESHKNYKAAKEFLTRVLTPEIAQEIIGRVADKKEEPQSPEVAPQPVNPDLKPELFQSQPQEAQIQTQPDNWWDAFIDKMADKPETKKLITAKLAQISENPVGNEKSIRDSVDKVAPDKLKEVAQAETNGNDPAQPLKDLVSGIRLATPKTAQDKSFNDRVGNGLRKVYIRAMEKAQLPEYKDNDAISQENLKEKIDDILVPAVITGLLSDKATQPECVEAKKQLDDAFDKLKEKEQEVNVTFPARQIAAGKPSDKLVIPVGKKTKEQTKENIADDDQPLVGDTVDDDPVLGNIADAINDALKQIGEPTKAEEVQPGRLPPEIADFLKSDDNNPDGKKTKPLDPSLLDRFKPKDDKAKTLIRGKKWQAKQASEVEEGKQKPDAAKIISHQYQVAALSLIEGKPEEAQAAVAIIRRYTPQLQKAELVKIKPAKIDFTQPEVAADVKTPWWVDEMESLRKKDVPQDLLNGLPEDQLADKKAEIGKKIPDLEQGLGNKTVELLEACQPINLASALDEKDQDRLYNPSTLRGLEIVERTPLKVRYTEPLPISETMIGSVRTDQFPKDEKLVNRKTREKAVQKLQSPEILKKAQDDYKTAHDAYTKKNDADQNLEPEKQLLDKATKLAALRLLLAESPAQAGKDGSPSYAALKSEILGILSRNPVLAQSLVVPNTWYDKAIKDLDNDPTDPNKENKRDIETALPAIIGAKSHLQQPVSAFVTPKEQPKVGDVKELRDAMLFPHDEQQVGAKKALTNAIVGEKPDAQNPQGYAKYYIDLANKAKDDKDKTQDLPKKVEEANKQVAALTAALASCLSADPTEELYNKLLPQIKRAREEAKQLAELAKKLVPVDAKVETVAASKNPEPKKLEPKPAQSSTTLLREEPQKAEVICWNEKATDDLKKPTEADIKKLVDDQLNQIAQGPLKPTIKKWNKDSDINPDAEGSILDGVRDRRHKDNNPTDDEPTTAEQKKAKGDLEKEFVTPPPAGKGDIAKLIKDGEDKQKTPDERKNAYAKAMAEALIADPNPDNYIKAKNALIELVKPKEIVSPPVDYDTTEPNRWYRERIAELKKTPYHVGQVNRMIAALAQHPTIAQNWQALQQTIKPDIDGVYALREGFDYNSPARKSLAANCSGNGADCKNGTVEGGWAANEYLKKVVDDRALPKDQQKLTTTERNNNLYMAMAASLIGAPHPVTYDKAYDLLRQIEKEISDQDPYSLGDDSTPRQENKWYNQAIPNLKTGPKQHLDGVNNAIAQYFPQMEPMATNLARLGGLPADQAVPKNVDGILSIRKPDINLHGAEELKDQLATQCAGTTDPINKEGGLSKQLFDSAQQPGINPQEKNNRLYQAMAVALFGAPNPETYNKAKAQLQELDLSQTADPNQPGKPKTDESQQKTGEADDKLKPRVRPKNWYGPAMEELKQNHKPIHDSLSDEIDRMFKSPDELQPYKQTLFDGDATLPATVNGIRRADLDGKQAEQDILTDAAVGPDKKNGLAKKHIDEAGEVTPDTVKQLTDDAIAAKIKPLEQAMICYLIADPVRPPYDAALAKLILLYREKEERAKPRINRLNTDLPQKPDGKPKVNRPTRPPFNKPEEDDKDQKKEKVHAGPGKKDGPPKNEGGQPGGDQGKKDGLPPQNDGTNGDNGPGNKGGDNKGGGKKQTHDQGTQLGDSSILPPKNDGPPLPPNQQGRRKPTPLLPPQPVVPITSVLPKTKPQQQQRLPSQHRSGGVTGGLPPQPQFDPIKDREARIRAKIVASQHQQQNMSDSVPSQAQIRQNSTTTPVSTDVEVNVGAVRSLAYLHEYQLKKPVIDNISPESVMTTLYKIYKNSKGGEVKEEWRVTAAQATACRIWLSKAGNEVGLNLSGQTLENIALKIQASSNFFGENMQIAKPEFKARSNQMTKDCVNAILNAANPNTAVASATHRFTGTAARTTTKS